MKKSVLLSACLLLFLAGCSKKSETEATKLSEDQKQAILNYANSITDNLLTGFNEANYTKYSRDFDEKSLARELNRLSSEKIAHYKTQSCKAAKELNAHNNCQHIQGILSSLLIQ